MKKSAYCDHAVIFLTGDKMLYHVMNVILHAV